MAIESIIYTEDQKKLLRIINARTAAMKRIVPPRVKDWVTMTDPEYNAVVEYCMIVHRVTSVIGDANYINQHGLNADGDFKKHLSIIRRVLELVFDDQAGFRDLLPPGTNRNFMRALAEMHDFSRFVFNNGKTIPIWIVDAWSSKLTKQVFPGMPEGYLHKLEWVTGVEKVPERANFALAFKAIDTVGKPGVEPADFYSPGGIYEKWKTRNAGHFPQRIPIRTGGFKTVSLEEFADNDRMLTERGIGIIDNIGDQGYFRNLILAAQKHI